MSKAQGGLNIAAAKVVAAHEDEGQVIELLDHDGEQLVYGPDDGPVTVTGVGSYSTRYRKAVDKQRREMIKRRRMKTSASDLFENQIELEAACVIAWAGIFDGNKEVECNPTNAAALLTNVPWFREQVTFAMEDHAGFFESA